MEIIEFSIIFSVSSAGYYLSCETISIFFSGNCLSQWSPFLHMESPLVIITVFKNIDSLVR